MNLRPVATALHPPAFSIVLAVLDLVRRDAVDVHRIALAFIAACTIFGAACTIFGIALVDVGLIGHRNGHRRPGLPARSPSVQWGGRLLSESVYLVVIPMLLRSALHGVDRPG